MPMKPLYTALLATTAGILLFLHAPQASAEKESASPKNNVVAAAGCLSDDGWQGVLWHQHVGTLAANNQLRKSGGTFGWNAEATSTQTIRGDGAVRFNASTSGSLNNNSICLGLSAENVNPKFDTIDYAILQFFDVEFRVVENGEMKAVLGALDPAAELEIERTGRTIRYKINGAVSYTSQVPSIGDLIVDTSLYAPGATVDEALIRATNLAAAAPASAPGIELKNAGGSSRLSWFGDPGRAYWLQWTEDMETWSESPGPYSGTGTEIEVDVQSMVSASANAALFRVRGNCPPLAHVGNSIIIDNQPSPVLPRAAVDVDLSYNADVPASIQLRFRDANNNVIEQSSVQVEPGRGRQTVAVRAPASPGENYNLSARLLDAGQGVLATDLLSGVAVRAEGTPPPANNIALVNPPLKPERDGSATVTVNFSADQPAYVLVRIRNATGNLEQAFIEVGPGAGSTSFSIGVPDATGGGYEWHAQLLRLSDWGGLAEDVSAEVVIGTPGGGGTNTLAFASTNIDPLNFGDTVNLTVNYELIDNAKIQVEALSGAPGAPGTVRLGYNTAEVPAGISSVTIPLTIDENPPGVLNTVQALLWKSGTWIPIPIQKPSFTVGRGGPPDPLPEIGPGPAETVTRVRVINGRLTWFAPVSRGALHYQVTRNSRQQPQVNFPADLAALGGEVANRIGIVRNFPGYTETTVAGGIEASLPLAPFNFEGGDWFSVQSWVPGDYSGHSRPAALPFTGNADSDRVVPFYQTFDAAGNSSLPGVGRRSDWNPTPQFNEEFRGVEGQQLSARAHGSVANGHRWHFAPNGVTPAFSRNQTFDDRHAEITRDVSSSADPGDGVLKMTIDIETGAYSYIDTATHFGEGYFVDPSKDVFVEASVKLNEASPANNAWWAFWLFADSESYNCNAADGTEIDFFEFVPDQNNGFNTAIFRNSSVGNCPDGFSGKSSPGNRGFTYEFANQIPAIGKYLDGRYHRIGMYWSVTENTMIFYVDDTPYWTLQGAEATRFMTTLAANSIRLTWELQESGNVWSPDGPISATARDDNPAVYIDWVKVCRACPGGSGSITRNGGMKIRCRESDGRNSVCVRHRIEGPSPDILRRRRSDPTKPDMWDNF